MSKKFLFFIYTLFSDEKRLYPTEQNKNIKQHIICNDMVFNLISVFYIIRVYENFVFFKIKVKKYMLY